MSKQSVLVVIYMLTEVNMEKETATLLVRKKHSGNAKEYHVGLSKLLCYKLREGKIEENKEYSSELLSDSREDNPIKLVQFYNKDETLKNNRVECVEEKGYSFIEYYDVFKQKTTKVIYHYWKKSEFIRYQQVILK